jgi:hypothetical protein
VNKAILWLVVIALIVGFFGYSRSSAMRRASRVVSFTLFAFFGLAAAASLYGTFALSDKGGGTLLFLAIPCGFIAWIFWNAFSSSAAREGYFDLNVEGKIAHNQTLIDSQILDHQQTITRNEEKLGSFWLTPGKRRRLREEVSHSRLMMASLMAMKTTVADPGIYRDDESRASGERGM